MEKAIKRAKEGGWSVELDSGVSERGSFWVKKSKTIRELQLWQETCFDPLFWQALGKSLGWKESYTKEDAEWKTMTIEQMQYQRPSALMHRFIDHLIAGGSVDEFFNQLLK